MLAGLATNCEIMKRSMFYRKNYFYPDMAKNFQTTQGPVAFCMGGWLDVEVGAKGAAERWDDGEVARNEDGSYTAHVGITRIHMEEDAAKMVHVGGAEGRIGGRRPLAHRLQPLRHAAHRARDRARPAQPRGGAPLHGEAAPDLPHAGHLGLLHGDGLHALRRQREPAPPRHQGVRHPLRDEEPQLVQEPPRRLEYEIRRQAEVLEEGGVVYQETRHWDVSAKRTLVMRTKETADDYRFFPEPDIAPFDLTDEFVDGVRAKLPELPDARRDRYVPSYGVKLADAAQLAGDPAVAAFFEEAVAGAHRKLARRWPTSCSTTSPATSTPRARPSPRAPSRPPRCAASPSSSRATPSARARAARCSASWRESGEDPAKIVDERGMRQVSDTAALEPVVDEVLAACPDQVAQYRAGNAKVVGTWWASA